ncbi:MAG: hypothetical protein JNL01_08065 [Bdellovibrionales bacterium]|nr:hypothetical protein [Bdellovibrionales bacterium]
MRFGSIFFLVAALASLTPLDSYAIDPQMLRMQVENLKRAAEEAKAAGVPEDAIRRVVSLPHFSPGQKEGMLRNMIQQKHQNETALQAGLTQDQINQMRKMPMGMGSNLLGQATDRALLVKRARSAGIPDDQIQKALRMPMGMGPKVLEKMIAKKSVENAQSAVGSEVAKNKMRRGFFGRWKERRQQRRNSYGNSGAVSKGYSAQAKYGNGY